jgi:hypothetical protein
MIKSLFLTAEPSPLYGAARLLDIGAVFDVYNTSEDGKEADLRALYSDWKAIGDALRESASQPR